MSQFDYTAAVDYILSFADYERISRSSAIFDTSRIETLLPNESISPPEALQLYTIDAAYAGFEESVKGSITQGKLADLVILSADPATVPPDQIREIEVLATILDGKVVWQK